MRTKKGIVTAFTVFFWLILFAIVFSLFLGGWLLDETTTMVTQNNLTGIEAFLAENFIVLFIMVAFIAAFAYIQITGGG